MPALTRWSASNFGEKNPKKTGTDGQEIGQIREALKEAAEWIWIAFDIALHAAIWESLIMKRGVPLFQPLGHAMNNRSLFIPSEVDLPDLSPAVLAWIVKPTD